MWSFFISLCIVLALMHTNLAQSDANHTTTEIFSVCNQVGNFTIENTACKSYRSCQLKNDSFVHTVNECPDNLIFSADTNECTSNAMCPVPIGFKCGNESKYVRSDSRTCSSYISCKNGGAISVNCPPNTVFSWNRLHCADNIDECPNLNRAVKKYCANGVGRYDNIEDLTCGSYILCSKSYIQNSNNSYLVTSTQKCANSQLIFDPSVGRCIDLRGTNYRCGRLQTSANEINMSETITASPSTTVTNQTSTKLSSASPIAGPTMRETTTSGNTASTWPIAVTTPEPSTIPPTQTTAPLPSVPMQCSPSMCITLLSTNLYKHDDPCWFISCMRNGLNVNCVESPCKPNTEYCEISRQCIPSIRCPAFKNTYCQAAKCPSNRSHHDL